MAASEANENRLITKLEELRQRYDSICQEMNDPATASNPQKLMTLGKEMARLEKIATPFSEYCQLLDEVDQARQLLADDETDADLREMANEEVAEGQEKAEAVLEELKATLVMSDEDSIGSLVMEIRAGTGGDEAALFARNLLEMYTRYSEKYGWRMETMSISPTELGGLREVIVAIKGEGVWKHLAFEGGGHRVQRVPETETQGRIHTSAATVAVLPERDDIEIDINWEKDVEEQTMRASGPGGQSVNKLESAIRLRHLETGITVSMRDEKSQHKNRAKARRIMTARLFDHFQSQTLNEEAAARKSMIGSGDRSQRIRTYNYPQNRCTDHRIGYNGNLQQILAGELDDLVNSLIVDETARRLSSL